MHITKTLATLVAAAGLASADFYIYIGGENYLIPGIVGGGPGFSSQADVVYFFNSVPACDTSSSPSLFSPTNDIHGGSSWACDGCSNYDDNGNITPTRSESSDYNAGENSLNADQRTLSGDGLGDVVSFHSNGQAMAELTA